MKHIDKVKAYFVAVFTAVTGWLGILAVPFYILVLTNLIDYTTGIYASVCRGEKVSSAKGLRGIAKKVCMWLLVVVGAIVDYIIVTITGTLHIELGFYNIVAIAVVFWLLANELISILENISDIGTPLPPFLLKIVGYIKERTEETVDIETDSK